MSLTRKIILYKGHQIEVLRYAGISNSNGLENYVMWSANVDGVRVFAYNLFRRRNVVELAKRQIDLLNQAEEQKELVKNPEEQTPNESRTA